MWLAAHGYQRMLANGGETVGGEGINEERMAQGSQCSPRRRWDVQGIAGGEDLGGYTIRLNLAAMFKRHSGDESASTR